MSLSKIVVSGRVSRAPEKRFTPNTNVAVTEFSIAVESPPRNDGSTESTFVKVTCWRELAERCFAEIKKGDLVVVDGRLQIENFTSSEGQKKRQAEIEAQAVEIFTGSGEQGSKAGNAQGQVLAGAKAASKASAGSGDDLDAMFAQEDEIPF